MTIYYHILFVQGEEADIYIDEFDRRPNRRFLVNLDWAGLDLSANHEPCEVEPWDKYDELHYIDQFVISLYRGAPYFGITRVEECNET